MFDFIFCGNDKQLKFFLDSINKRLPEVKITTERKNDEDVRCEMEDNSEKTFLVGMVLAACYSAFNEHQQLN